MIDRLKSLAVFAAVVDEGSFRGAAELLSLSPSVVSRHIAMLEDNIGTSLLYRTTRTVSLTRDGEALYASAKTMSEAAKDGLALFSDKAEGRLTDIRVAISVTLTAHPIFGRIAAFARNHTGIRLHMFASDTQKDLIGDNIDVAIRTGEFPDSDLLSRRISEDRLVPVAAPNYFNDRTTPTRPDDMQNHDFIHFGPTDPFIRLQRQGDDPVKVWGRTAVITDSAQTMQQLAIAGVGIAALPYHCVKDDLRTGKLRRLLPEYSGQELGLYCVWPRHADRNVAVRRFLDYITGEQG